MTPNPARRMRRGMLVAAAGMIAVHLACFAAIFTGVSAADLALCAGLYVVRMFAITAGYHRYFSHRTYKMGRIPQFLMACLAQSSAQRGVLWWAAHHRHHHRTSDTEEDRHSPADGFWWSHIGWILVPEHQPTEHEKIRDFSRYPELRFIDRWHLLPPVTLAAIVFLLTGWSGLIVGFFWSTVLLWHGTFTINSLAHVIGTRTYPTTDTSKNHWLLALITLGEGWHNNHHHYQASTAQGFRWWQIDITYRILKVLELLRIVRGVSLPPRHVVFMQPHPKTVQPAAPVVALPVAGPVPAPIDAA